MPTVTSFSPRKPKKSMICNFVSSNVKEMNDFDAKKLTTDCVEQNQQRFMPCSTSAAFARTMKPYFENHNQTSMNVSDDDDNESTNFVCKSRLSEEEKEVFASASKRHENVFSQQNSKRKLSKRRTQNRSPIGDIDSLLTKKKIKINEDEEPSDPLISKSAQNMMKMMGYKRGEGLGKHSQGIVAPVSVSKQKGRRGLGLIIADVDRSSIKYDPSKEVTSVREEVSWLADDQEVDLSTLDLSSWIVIDKKKKQLDDETHFCDPNILSSVLTCKTALDRMSGEELRRARSRSNPFELIKKGPFLNRAAMKMANMDYVFDHMFTNPVDEFQNPLIENNDLLYFADVCAGPGGFSEYVLSKKKWEAKGFGFTLIGDNDFKLADFFAGPCESFEPFYGDGEDGDIYKTKNITSFTRHVMQNTDSKGVHFMMADGGFSVEGQENIQEILSKRIYLCQSLVALSIVRTGGHFVCKLFDIFTPFSVGLVYLLYRCFRRISLHKPNTSRPANSERYIICKWKREAECTDPVKDYMFQLNQMFDEYGEASNVEIDRIVPIDLMKNSRSFFEYILSSNNEFGLRQINSLAKILEFAEDESLVEERQQSIKKECMELWGIPMKARSGPLYNNPENLCRKCLQNDIDFVRRLPRKLTIDCMSDSLYSVHDYHAVLLGSNKNATFFLGVAHKKCYKYDQSHGKWDSVHELGLELSPETLIYGEIVQELIGQTLGQRKINVLHIIDGHTLGGKNISNLHYTERIAQCALYSKSLSRPSMYNVMPIRMKPIFELENLEEGLFRLVNIVMKNSSQRIAFSLDDAANHQHNHFFLPQGLMFLKATKFPYRRFISRSNNLKYYWAPKKDPLFDQDRPQESVSCFKESYRNSFVWYLDEQENVPFQRKTFVTELLRYVSENRFTKRNEK